LIIACIIKPPMFIPCRYIFECCQYDVGIQKRLRWRQTDQCGQKYSSERTFAPSRRNPCHLGREDVKIEYEAKLGNAIEDPFGLKVIGMSSEKCKV
jgi:hypothetical protein